MSLKARLSPLARTLASCLFLILFLAAPAWGLRFVVISDAQGVNPGQDVNLPVFTQVEQRILALEPRPAFVVITGDTVRVGGRADGSVAYGAWIEAARPLTSAGIAVWPVVGNHELYREGVWDVLFRNLQEAHQKAFEGLPQDGPEDYKGLAYSFEDPSSDSFFAVLDTYHLPKSMDSVPYTRRGFLRSEQLDWLAERLAETRMTNRFVFGHNPVFSPREAGHACAGNWCELWRIMSHGGVRIYFAGHDHIYARKVVEAGDIPEAEGLTVQVVSPSCGGWPTPADKVPADASWHIHSGYGFEVVDVERGSISVTAWGLTGSGWQRFDGFDITPSRN